MLLESLNGQINSNDEDKRLEEAIQSAFGSNLEARSHQVALIRVVTQQEEKIVIGEWPCASGKSTSIAVYGRFMCS
jgi:hypothetical protein